MKKVKKGWFGWSSIAALVVAVAPWALLIDGVAPRLVNAHGGYAGMFLAMGVYAWSIAVCLVGTACAVISLVRREPRPLIALVGMALNVYGLSVLKQ